MKNMNKKNDLLELHIQSVIVNVECKIVPKPMRMKGMSVNLIEKENRLKEMRKVWNAHFNLSAFSPIQIVRLSRFVAPQSTATRIWFDYTNVYRLHHAIHSGLFFTSNWKCGLVLDFEHVFVTLWVHTCVCLRLKRSKSTWSWATIDEKPNLWKYIQIRRREYKTKRMWSEMR